LKIKQSNTPLTPSPQQPQYPCSPLLASAAAALGTADSRNG
jgi:hypothetical protein